MVAQLLAQGRRCIHLPFTRIGQTMAYVHAQITE